jgi:hypothetical protein
MAVAPEPAKVTPPAPKRPPTLEVPAYGKRQDGSYKGPGFFGPVNGTGKLKGKTVTEYTIGVPINGTETEIPSIVPTLTRTELDTIKSGGMTPEIVAKATKHAQERIAQGRSPFADEQDWVPPSAKKAVQEALSQKDLDWFEALPQVTSNRQYDKKIPAGSTYIDPTGIPRVRSQEFAENEPVSKEPWKKDKSLVEHYSTLEGHGQLTPEQWQAFPKKIQEAIRSGLDEETTRLMMRAEVFKAMSQVEDRRQLLATIRALPENDRRLFLEELPNAIAEMEEDRPGVLWRLGAAPARGGVQMAQSYAETFGAGGTDEEIAVANLLRSSEESIAGTREEDPWYQKWPIQAAEQTLPVMAIVRGGKLAGKPGLTVVGFPAMYRAADSAMAEKGIEGPIRKPVAMLTGWAASALEGIVPNPFKGMGGVAGKGLMRTAANWAVNFAKNFPGELSEEYLQAGAQQLGVVIAERLDKDVPNEGLGTVFSEAWRGGNEAIGPLLVMMGAPAAVQLPLAALESKLERLNEIRSKGWVTAEEGAELGLSEEELKNRNTRKAAVDQQIQETEKGIQGAQEVRGNQGLTEEEGDVGQGGQVEGGEDLRGNVEEPLGGGQAAAGQVGGPAEEQVPESEDIDAAVQEELARRRASKQAAEEPVEEPVVEPTVVEAAPAAPEPPVEAQAAQPAPEPTPAVETQPEAARWPETAQRTVEELSWEELKAEAKRLGVKLGGKKAAVLEKVRDARQKVEAEAAPPVSETAAQDLQQRQVDSLIQSAEKADEETALYRDKKGNVLVATEYAQGTSRAVVHKDGSFESLGAGPVNENLWSRTEQPVAPPVSEPTAQTEVTQPSQDAGISMLLSERQRLLDEAWSIAESTGYDDFDKRTTHRDYVDRLTGIDRDLKTRGYDVHQLTPLDRYFEQRAMQRDSRRRAEQVRGTEVDRETGETRAPQKPEEAIETPPEAEVMPEAPAMQPAPAAQEGAETAEAAPQRAEEGGETAAVDDAVQKELESRPTPKRSERKAEEAKAKKAKLQAAMRKLIDPTELSMGLNPHKVKQAVDVLFSALDYGITEFDRFISFAVETIGEKAVRDWAPYLESAWRQGGPTPAGKVEEVLGKPAEETPPPKHPEEQAEEALQPEDDLTSIKKAVVNDLRALVGLPEMEGSTPQTVEEWAETARLTLAADPKAAIRLVNELATNPRPISQHDAMLLQFRYRQLANELEPAVDEYLEAVKSKDPVAIATARTEVINRRSAMTTFEEIIHPSKETWGRTGVALQQMLRKDFSLEAILRRGQESNNGEELSPDQVVELTKLAKELEALQKRFDEQSKKMEEMERELASKAQHEEVVKEAKRNKSKAKPTKRQEAEALRKAAWSTFKEKWAALGHVGAIYDPKAEAKKQAELLSAAVDLAKAYAQEGFVRFKEFWTSIKANIGKDADQAEAVFRQAWDQVVADGTVVKPDVDLSDRAGLSKDARRIQRLLVESGITDRDEVIDEVRAIMSEDLPDFTRRQAMDALSLYGQFKTPSQDEINKLIRDMNAEILKLSQIDQLEIASKRAEELRKEGKTDAEIGDILGREDLHVKATGLVWDKPTEAVRKLTKVYNDLKKTIPATSETRVGRLQTAEASVERALRNRIKDVRWELDNQERIVRETHATPENEVIQKLRSELDMWTKMHREYFPPQRPQMTPEHKLANAERAARRMLTYMLEQEKAGFPPPAAKPTPLTSAQLEATRNQIKEIRARRDAAQREGKRVADLDRQITKLEDRLRTGAIAPKVRPTPYTTPMIEARIARRKQLQAELEARQKAEMPELFEARARKAYEASLRKRIADYKQILADGDFAPKAKKEPRVLSDSELKLKRQMEDVRHEVLRKFAEYHLAHLHGIAWGADKVMELSHLVRALKTSFDASALLRQGGVIAAGHPLMAKRVMVEVVASLARQFDSERALALGKGVTVENLKAFVNTIDSRQAEFDFMHKLTSGPDGEFRLRAGLHLTSSDEAITRQEEVFQGRWGKYVPGVALSGRVWTMTLNKLRADLFDLMVQNLGRGGAVTMDEAKLIAGFVNVVAGRGSFAKADGKIAAALNLIFFAPRYVASRFQYLAMPFYLPFKGGINQNWRVKRAIYKEYARTATGIATVLGAFAMAASLFYDDDDDDKPTIETDARSADFLKVRIGETRLDFLAGLSQVFVLSQRLAPEWLGGGATKSSISGKVTKFGEGYKPSTRGTVLAQAGRTKLAPVPGYITTALNEWENVVGQKKNRLLGYQVHPAVGTTAEMFYPLSMSDIGETMEAQGVAAGSAMSTLALLGVGMSTYGPKTTYVMGTPEERKEQFAKDVKNLQWDSKLPAYSEFLTSKQVDKVNARIEEKKGSVLHEGLTSDPEPPKRKPEWDDDTYQEKLESHQEKLETWEKARQKMRDMTKTLGLSQTEAQQLLVQYYRRPGEKDPNEFKGKTSKLQKGYLDKGYALAKLYGEADPKTAFWEWRRAWATANPPSRASSK